MRLALGAGVEGEPVFSPCRRYRYRLERRWAVGKPVLFIMMNPSTADITADDPTVAKCQRFVRAWGFGALLVGNVCAYRATDKMDLLRVDDPRGPANMGHLRLMADEAVMIVLAHGKLPGDLDRQHAAPVRRMLATAGHTALVLAQNKDGSPKHPLYIRGDALPYPPWREKAGA